MARILTVATGLPGPVHSSIELSRRLAADGHELGVASEAAYREAIERNQLRFLPLEASGYARFLEDDRKRGLLSRLVHLGERRDAARSSLALSSFVDTVREFEPELVLIDGEMHEHIVASAGLEAPVLLLNCFCSIWRQVGLPLPHTSVRPGEGWRGTRPAIALQWLAFRFRKRLRTWLRTIRHLGCDRRSMLKLLSKQVDFDFAEETDETQWLIPLTYRRMPVLSLHALEFEFPHHPPDRVTYVGPMILESRPPERSFGEMERLRLTAILDRHLDGDGQRLIYAGFGSAFSTDLSLLKRLFAALADRPEWELIVSLSGRIAPDDLGPLPDRVHAFDWVPQTEVLKQSDVAITHGGINTLDECVMSAVPVLVYCGFETDMAGNTARVVHHGIGIAGDAKRDTSETIRAYLDRLMEDPRFTGTLEGFRNRYLVYAEAQVAETAIRRALGRGRQ